MNKRISLLNPVIRRWINYFAINMIKGKLADIDTHLLTMLRKVIWKQWKTPSKRAIGLWKKGVEKDLARHTSYCGDRYEWVVGHICNDKYISKEILYRNGLVSCLDCYLIRHSLKTN